MVRLTKPLTRKVTTRMTSHRFRPEIVVRLNPDGTLELRELGLRQAPVLIDLATLYVQARVQEARQRIAGR